MDVMLSSPDAAASPQAATADIAMLLRAAEQHRKLAQLLPDEDMRREMLAEADKQEAQAQALMRRGAAGAGGTWQDLDAQRLSVGPQQPPPPAPGVGSFVDRNGRVVEFQKGPVVEPAVASAPPPGVGNFVDRYGRVVEFHKRPADEPIGAGSSELAASVGGAPAPAGSTVRAVLRRDSGGLFKLGLREGAGGVLIGRLPLSDAEGDERTRLCEGDLVLAINGLRTNTMSFEQLRSYVKECPGALHLEPLPFPGVYGGNGNDHFPQASPPPPPMYPPPPPGPPPPDGMYSGAMSEEELLQVAMHLSLAEAQAQQAAERAALETALRASATETPVGDLHGELGAQPPTIAEDLATVFAGRVPAPAVEPPNFC
ncbi:hypothetical protein Ctob_000777 [Chrysochromulina tobinii]|uniref:PDZ domain-containing protein n=1 Tax=Chrysochromulina tobinii TaxID=1460289 RepID=A0A0M0JB94_9EUKA|nr:hypothetical protein Ctob_000777 [Chrysochromulina tobinii]|eukprot:KOO23846.1 hypothetical protein Ctob_000777 [Chrysochromulina sp. CCMP291]